VTVVVKLNASGADVVPGYSTDVLVESSGSTLVMVEVTPLPVPVLPVLVGSM
jgi:hypothetical protein